MITTSYNPSSLEVQFGEILKSLKDEIDSRLPGNVVQEILVDKEKDNPNVLIRLMDEDGDKHELVIKLIQRSDLMVNQK